MLSEEMSEWNPYTDPNWLYDRYHGERMSMTDIANLVGCNSGTIKYHMDKYGIETRNRSEAVRGEHNPMAGRTGENHPNYGVSWGKEARRNMAESHEGLTGEGAGWDDERRKVHSESMSGGRNPAWRGGYQPPYGRGWRTAREDALERDDHQCRRCGSKNERIEVHHIEPVRRFREDPSREEREAHELSNLVTLCAPCHREVEWRGEELGINTENL